MDKPETKSEQYRKIAFKLDPDRPADSIIHDKEQDVHCLVIVVPLTMPKHMAMGYLWHVLNNLTDMFKAADAKAADRSKPSILRAGMDEAAALGKRFLPRD